MKQKKYQEVIFPTTRPKQKMQCLKTVKITGNEPNICQVQCFLGCKPRNEPHKEFLMQTIKKPAGEVICNGNHGSWRPQQEGKDCKIS
jgi:hypothetical protein